MYIFSLGKRQYEVDTEWIKLPKSISIQHISDIATDRERRVFVLQRSDPFILIFSPSGDLLTSWSDKSITDGHYFHVTENGEVIIVDRDHHRIVFLDHRGLVVSVIGGSPGDIGKPFNHPTDVAPSADDGLFVSDGYGNACVHHINSSGKVFSTWGTPGTKPSEFSTPHSLILDKSRRILVADRENDRIQVFDKKGKFIEEWNNVFHPMKIVEDEEGLIYVTDQTPSLNLFTPSGERIGRCRTFGTYAHGVTVDNKGNIYLAEMFHDRITKLKINSSSI